MGRQFRFYLLPSDVDRLLDDLKGTVGLRVLADTSRDAEPAEVGGATQQRGKLSYGNLTQFSRIHLAPPCEAEITTWFAAKRNEWLIDSSSETIEFDTCAHSPEVLIQGRMYHQIDKLTASKDAIVLKSQTFIKWAELIYRRAKKQLQWSAELDAYIGHDAALWQQQGGRFAVH